ncbi:hypothetical protein PGT21_024665 [Puccinia graminis f. sp. tritici]|uniref:Uncharacterized protein n=1 Tax=Puccinia graminis f. sp. tritici TaxID=56615 RepID=A0A5B0N1G5_PUCGR|nr:hypothetical protein PGT21_024665 [Puccinia graminis f. sp. tritici]KAA1123983.1 hypothetical protein PGTUg99_015952 [Puccinia graminis f. sp. tritici]
MFFRFLIVGLIFNTIHALNEYRYMRIFPGKDDTYVEYSSEIPSLDKHNIQREKIPTPKLYAVFKSLDRGDYIIQAFQTTAESDSGLLGNYIVADTAPRGSHWGKVDRSGSSCPPFDPKTSKKINDVISQVLEGTITLQGVTPNSNSQLMLEKSAVFQPQLDLIGMLCLLFLHHLFRTLVIPDHFCS